MKDIQNSNILILVADDDKKARSFIAGVLETAGFPVIQAIDAGTAIRVIEEHKVDVAIIDHHMKPHDGFEVARHILVQNRPVGSVLLTDDPSTDILLQAGQHGIAQVMNKPVEPDRLIQTVRRMLRKQGKNPDAIGAGATKAYTPDDLMQRAIALAAQNVQSGMGGPFAAIVADTDGRILGEGVNGVALRSDPTAHAEVMAIRRATDKLNTPRLDGCVIYCSSEPTMLGQALIIGTGIQKVYYGASHIEAGTPRLEEEGILGEIAKPMDQRSVAYEQCRRDDALALLHAWQEDKAKRVQ